MPSEPKTTLGVILEPARTRGPDPEPLPAPFFETVMEPVEIKNLDFTCGGFALTKPRHVAPAILGPPGIIARVRSLFGRRAGQPSKSG
jgi:hypothetical protein